MGNRGLRLAFATALSGWAGAQSPPPGRTEVHTDEPFYQGYPAAAPIPPEMHIQNEGGSDRAGLCVISSILADGMFQGVPGLEGGKNSDLWRTAKSRPGGYYPEKLTGLVDETNPGEGYASLLGKDPRDLDKLSKMGYPIGLTMDTGELYGWSKISHMVSYLLFDWDNDIACHVDNNAPGVYTWTSAREALSRAIDDSMGEYWAWIWTRLPESPLSPGTEGEDAPIFAAAAVVVLVAIRKSRTS